MPKISLESASVQLFSITNIPSTSSLTHAQMLPLAAQFSLCYPRCLVPLHAACCDENASGHHLYNKMQLSDGNSTCQVVKNIIRSPNRTNRPSRQTCKGSLLVLRCNFRLENTICHIEHNI